MALEKNNLNLTSFITPLGHYKWKRFPMGLASAPGFSKPIRVNFCWPLSRNALVYIDYVLKKFRRIFVTIRTDFPTFSGECVKKSGNFFLKACPLLGAPFIWEWNRGWARESKNGRNNGRTVLRERRQGLSKPCGLFWEIHFRFRKDGKTSLQVTE